MYTRTFDASSHATALQGVGSVTNIRLTARALLYRLAKALETTSAQPYWNLRNEEFNPKPYALNDAVAIAGGDLGNLSIELLTKAVFQT